MAWRDAAIGLIYSGRTVMKLRWKLIERQSACYSINCTTIYSRHKLRCTCISSFVWTKSTNINISSRNCRDLPWIQSRRRNTAFCQGTELTSFTALAQSERLFSLSVFSFKKHSFKLAFYPFYHPRLCSDCVLDASKVFLSVPRLCGATLAISRAMSTERLNHYFKDF